MKDDCLVDGLRFGCGVLIAHLQTVREICRHGPVTFVVLNAQCILNDTFCSIATDLSFSEDLRWGGAEFVVIDTSGVMDLFACIEIHKIYLLVK